MPYGRGGMRMAALRTLVFEQEHLTYDRKNCKIYVIFYLKFLNRRSIKWIWDRLGYR